MKQLRRDFRSAPVPIRLSCPFTNGITLNYYARALTCNGRVLRVLSVNPFERDLQLIVAAPFFNGPVRCQVASITRSKRLASSYELDLRYGDTPTLRGTSEDRWSDVSVDSSVEALPIHSVDIAQTASELAVALETNLGIPFAKAFAQVRVRDRHLKLLALIAAMLSLAREKGLADPDVVATVLRRKPSGAMGASLPTPEGETTMEQRAG